MKKGPIFKAAAALIITGCVAVSAHASGSEGVHWGYSGDNGPEHWGQLSPDFSMCGTGKNQSPVNLTSFIEAELEPLAMQYATEAIEVLNNGHAIQVNFAPGSSLEVEGRKYELKQIHFHSPSENVIDGKFYPMEGHLVHADAKGQLAVVAVMYEDGPVNSAIAATWQEMPGAAGEKKPLAGVGTVEGFLPGSRDYYRFNGSLTTPPCTEGVTWLVLKESAKLTADQIGQFQKVMGMANNRPVQPTNARMILE
ncbi:carbonic anhydrase [Desulfopila aestuarii]|uniref:Carbonic anhydrase n=1 Tax=Desulfopila aestuarii DSM 18488 TaxID=1121416 RepID=A0A1M7Y327_9BACT|nr:carbonic anhydrase family protein [Desulfopila aestuarii]SHO46408.1 carbonic anhydrase [Desulfopila aestuarii DSM 18488]